MEPTEISKEELRDLKNIFSFLDMCTKEAKALIVNEVLMLTPMYCFNAETKSLDKVESVSLNGETIQLNVE